MAVIPIDAQRGATPLVSVVVPTCRRPELLLRCLNAICEQVGVEGTVEVIVVDDARSDEQRAALGEQTRCGKRTQIFYRRPPPGRRTHPGLSGAKASSSMPFMIVTRDRPHARLTIDTPP